MEWGAGRHARNDASRLRPEPEKPQLEEPAPAPAELSAFANMTIEELKRMAGVSDVD